MGGERASYTSKQGKGQIIESATKRELQCTHSTCMYLDSSSL